MYVSIYKVAMAGFGDGKSPTACASAKGKLNDA